MPAIKVYYEGALMITLGVSDLREDGWPLPAGSVVEEASLTDIVRWTLETSPPLSARILSVVNV